MKMTSDSAWSIMYHRSVALQGNGNCCGMKGQAPLTMDDARYLRYRGKSNDSWIGKKALLRVSATRTQIAHKSHVDRLARLESDSGLKGG
jgi:hypothetical protein